MKLILRLTINEEMRRALEYQYNGGKRMTKHDLEMCCEGLVEADLDIVHSDWAQQQEDGEGYA